MSTATLPPGTTPDTTRDATGPWLVAGTATTVLAVVLGAFGSIGVLIDPLAAAYGAPRSHLVLLFATALAVHSLTARGAGRAVDRWGPRPALAVAAAGIGAGMLAPATATTTWVAVAGYGIGLGLASACTWVATTTVVSAAFTDRRAAALGLLAAGPAAGGVVIAPAAAALAVTGGPRVACAVLAVVGTAVCAAGALLIGDHRGSLRPTTEDAGSAATGRDARRFHAAGLLMGLVVFVPLVHLAGVAVDLGLTPAHGAALLALVSTMSAAARLGAGRLATPRSLPRLFLASHGLVAAGFAAWALAGPSTALPVLTGVALLFGTGYGAWLSLAPAILAARTDPRRLGRALGTHATAVGIGGVLGPVLASPLLASAPLPTLGGCAALAGLAALVLGARR
ncbi:MFS transporter [Pseudonocardia saturnea]